MIYKSHKATILFTIEQSKQMFKLEKCTNIWNLLYGQIWDLQILEFCFLFKFYTESQLWRLVVFLLVGRQ